MQLYQLQLLLLLLLLLNGLASSYPLYTLNRTLLLVNNKTIKSAFAFRIEFLQMDSQKILVVSDPIGYNNYTRDTSGIVYACNLKDYDLDSFKGILRKQICKRKLPLTYKFDKKIVETSVLKFGTSIAKIDNKSLVVCAPGYNYPTDFNLTAAPGLCGMWSSLTSRPEWIKEFYKRRPADGSAKDAALCFGGYDAKLARNGDGLQLAVSGPLCPASIPKVLDLDSSRSNGFRQSVPFKKYHRNPVYVGFSLAVSMSTAGNDFYATNPVLSQPEDPSIVSNNDIVLSSANAGNIDLKAFSYLGYSSAYLKSSSIGFVLLGAPYYTDLRNPAVVNRGCIVITRATAESTTIEKPVAKYCLNEANGRFGSSVVAIPDMDGDDIEEFAAGCPGCGIDGTGAVYVFRGQSDYNEKTKLEPMYIIDGQSFSPEIKGFGFSLAVGEANSDKLADLAIGAIGSGHVAVLAAGHLGTINFIEQIAKITFSNFDSVVHKFGLTVRSPPILYGQAIDIQYRFEAVSKENEIQMFAMECIHQVSNGWCTLRNKIISSDDIYTDIGYKLKPLFNRRGSPLSEDIALKFDGRVRLNLIGSDFKRTAFLFQKSLCVDYKCEGTFSLMEFEKLGDEDVIDAWLTLLSPEHIHLDKDQNVKIRLKFLKSLGSFLGGLAVQVTLSEHLSLPSQIYNTKNQSFSYSSNFNTILLSDSFGNETNKIINRNRHEMELVIDVKIGGFATDYSIGFELVSLASNRMIREGYASKLNPTLNKPIRVTMNLTSSVLLQLYRKRGDDVVVDERLGANEEKLKSLRDLTRGSIVGPELMQVFKLSAIAEPSIPIRNIQLDIKLPFATDDNELLLYFPRSFGFGVSGLDIVPGLPYLSSSESGKNTKGDPSYSECWAVESDLAQLLKKPNIVLLEGEHSINGTDEEARRKRREAPNEYFSLRSRTTSSDLRMRKSSLTEQLDCDNLAAAPFPLRCITFRCNVSLQPSENKRSQDAFLHIHARLWSPTYFKLQLQMFTIKSSVYLTWEPDAIFSVANVTNYAYFIQRFLFRGVEPAKDFPWEYVVLAIFIGLWLLLLCILLLWYCNFFRRRRYDYSAVAQKPPNDEDDDFYH